MANLADLKKTSAGKTEADAIGKSDFDLFPGRSPKKFYDDDQKVITANRSSTGREQISSTKPPETLAVDQQVAAA